MQDGIGTNILLILLTLFLVLVNAFFVAAEFALVKLRETRLKVLIRRKRPFAKTAGWLSSNLNKSLSACQLGITMASIGLGWIAEPALADLLRPVFTTLGVTSEPTLHSAVFALAFIFITAIHIVVGEQAPKMLAISKPEITVLSCSLPLKIFYIITYPFMWVLNKASNILLKAIGLSEATETEHESPLTEEEIRTLLAGAHARGELKKGKHQLLDAIFSMDKRLVRQIMVPRTDVVFFRLSQSLQECLETAHRTKHTRFPLCKHSLDDVVGVIHIKDLLGYPSTGQVDLEALARPPRMVPETMPASSLLKIFQASRQHLAFVLDEHGAVQGIVTMENALEEMVGSVQDEFDEEEPSVIPDGPGSFIVSGAAPLAEINEKLGIKLKAHRVDTISGLLFKHAGRVLKAGDRIPLGPVDAEVMEVRATRAWKIHLQVAPSSDENGNADKNKGLQGQDPG